MIPVAPATQRRFASSWAELDYLCKKIHYWLHVRKKRAEAMHFKDRLTRVLGELPKDNNLAILRCEGRALHYELAGKTQEAISHRKREIELIQRLHGEAQSPRYTEKTREYMLRGRDTAALKERHAILAALGTAAQQHLE